MSKSVFEIGLNKLKFTDEQSVNRLFWIKDKSKINDSYIRLTLENAEKFNVDAVYFRFFENKRSPIPQIYIYDFTTKSFDKQIIKEHNRRIWSSGQFQIFLIKGQPTWTLTFN